MGPSRGTRRQAAPPGGACVRPLRPQLARIAPFPAVRNPGGRAPGQEPPTRDTPFGVSGRASRCDVTAVGCGDLRHRCGGSISYRETDFTPRRLEPAVHTPAPPRWAGRASPGGTWVPAAGRAARHSQPPAHGRGLLGRVQKEPGQRWPSCTGAGPSPLGHHPRLRSVCPVRCAACGLLSGTVGPLGPDRPAASYVTCTGSSPWARHLLSRPSHAPQDGEGPRAPWGAHSTSWRPGFP